MVSIPHFEDLSTQEIYDLLDLKWRVSEKLDGTSLTFGLDDQGEFYCQGKNSPRFYNPADLPAECWATTFRVAFEVARLLADALVAEKQLASGQSIGAEVIHGLMPNSIPYGNYGAYNGKMIITSVDYPVSKVFYTVINDFKCSFVAETQRSPDGKWDSFPKIRQNWIVRANDYVPDDLVQAQLRVHRNRLRSSLDTWFPRSSNIEGFTNREVLDINLNRKHANTGSRNWTELKGQLKEERDSLRLIYQSMIMMFKDIAIRVLVHQRHSAVAPGSCKEGAVVVHQSGMMFKLVDREIFGPLNLYTHRIKYMLVGGRRPARPSFISRTKHWPMEKRLARLEVLLNRYLTTRFRLSYLLQVAGRQYIIHYSGELHQRMLNCFSDTKKRIQSGR